MVWECGSVAWHPGSKEPPAVKRAAWLCGGRWLGSGGPFLKLRWREGTLVCGMNLAHCIREKKQVQVLTIGNRMKVARLLFFASVHKCLMLDAILGDVRSK